MVLKILFIFALSFYYCSGNENPFVKTNLGWVRGKYLKSYNNRTFSAFEGIPYAKPPVGELRFEKAQEIDPWDGVWEATISHECIQIPDPTQDAFGDEDCLYVNVYVPRENPKNINNLDVIIHIHGGAFMMGSGHSYVKPTYLMDRDVIFVTFNYRLGILGFLSTQDEVVPGNNGLKDQTLALKWVKDNIKEFGGNPDSITITGLSAGGASVHFHYLSFSSKGLFNRGIAQSGTALNPWALQEAAYEKAKKLAYLLGCQQKTTKEFVKCMKQRPAKLLIEKTKDFYNFMFFPFAPFAPVVEKNSNDAFISEHPYKLLENGKVNDVPLIASFTTEEGIFPAAFLTEVLDTIDEKWERRSHILLDSIYTIVFVKQSKVAKDIKQFYFGNKKISKETMKELVDLFTHRHFTVDAEKALRMQAKVAKSPVYLYVFGYRGQHGFDELFSVNSSYKGVSHGDDALYLYDTLGVKKMTKADEDMKEIFLNMCTEFAKTGIPKVGDIDWKPISDELNYLSIKDPQNIKMEKAEELAPTEFWNSLPIEENDKIIEYKDEL